MKGFWFNNKAAAERFRDMALDTMVIHRVNGYYVVCLGCLSAKYIRTGNHPIA